MLHTKANIMHTNVLVTVLQGGFRGVEHNSFFFL